MLKLEQVHKIYQHSLGKVHALKNISIEVQLNKWTSLIGPSGSGKSTLLYVLGLLTQINQGQILFDFDNITNFSESKKSKIRKNHFGFVFQSFHLLPNLKAIDNVALPMFYHSMSKKDILKKAHHALDKVNLSHRVEHYPYQLSGGEQQRVAIARAIVTSPKFIFADEPTGNLDHETGMQILGIFRDLKKEGHTIVMATHDLSIAQSTDHIISLKDGEII